MDEKKTFILQELYDTEKNVVRVLKLICHSYHASVKPLISVEDSRLLFDTAQVHRDCLTHFTSPSLPTTATVPSALQSAGGAGEVTGNEARLRQSSG